MRVLPKAGLQRAADLLLGANARNSQILRESAKFPFTLCKVETAQNLTRFDSRDEYTPFSCLPPPCLPQSWLTFKAPPSLLLPHFLLLAPLEVQ